MILGVEVDASGVEGWDKSWGRQLQVGSSIATYL